MWVGARMWKFKWYAYNHQLKFRYPQDTDPSTENSLREENFYTEIQHRISTICEQFYVEWIFLSFYTKYIYSFQKRSQPKLMMLAVTKLLVSLKKFYEKFFFQAWWNLKLESIWSNGNQCWFKQTAYLQWSFNYISARMGDTLKCTSG